MRKFLFAPFMMNLGESQRLSQLAEFLSKKGHDIHVLGNPVYPFLFNKQEYIKHSCPYDDNIYNKERYDSFFSLSTDFNFLTEEEIENICSFERTLLRTESFDAVFIGYRLSIVTSCRLEHVPLFWMISGSTHIEEIINNSEGLLPNSLSNSKNMNVKSTIKNMITSYSNNVISWNNYIKKEQGLPFKNGLELFRGDLNLVADYSGFYDFSKENDYTVVGPILIQPDTNFTKVSDAPEKTILLSFGTSVSKTWLENFLQFLPKNHQYILTTGGQKLDVDSDNIDVVDFIDFNSLDNISFAIIHGGQGTVYAMANKGIPFIGIPFFNEQYWNIKKFSQQNCAILLRDYELPKLEDYITEFLAEIDFYSSNIASLSKKITQESMKSLYNSEAAIEKFFQHQSS